MTVRDDMDRIYREMSPEEIPWVLDDPPDILTGLVETGAVRPCRTADLGCGVGQYAVWLARRGFEVTGYDCSEEAIRLAWRAVRNLDVDCRFQVADLTGALDPPERPFEFAYHWGVLHHVFPEHRQAFAANVERMLRPGGRQLCMCFHESDGGFEGTDKFRRTPLGTTLYFSSEQEIRKLFEPGFRIESLYTVEITGKHRPHQAVVAWMEKR